MIPLCDIATLFASLHQHVTIITTPFNAQILRKSLSSADPSFLRIHTVDFPSQQVGLPYGVESISHTTDLAASTKIYRGAMLLHEPIRSFIEKNPPDCIVADFMYPWVHDIANTLRFPYLSFNGFSLFTVSLMESIRTNPSPDSDSDPDSASYEFPNFPHRITMCAKPPKIFTGFMDSLLEKELKVPDSSSTTSLNLTVKSALNTTRKSRVTKRGISVQCL